MGILVNRDVTSELTSMSSLLIFRLSRISMVRKVQVVFITLSWFLVFCCWHHFGLVGLACNEIRNPYCSVVGTTSES